MKDFPPQFQGDSKNIAIDFDGVIHNDDKGFHDGTCYGDPIPGSIEALKTLSNQYNIVIFTAKAKSDRPLVEGKTGKQHVESWLKKHDVLSCVKEITSEKPRAWIYIDDKGYRFSDWAQTLDFLEKI